jgi:asparagine synthase (glutamine-hydrolysing)
MPGIVGLITTAPRSWAERQVQAMLKHLVHEPFYVSGSWADEQVGVYIGWATQKGSFSEHALGVSEHSDVLVFFSGEDYSAPSNMNGVGRDRGLSNRLSYITRRYEQDPEFPSSLNGRFQGLAVDTTRGSATLFNDRYGMHRLYYHESKDGFYFAAEAKALLAVLPRLRTMNWQSVGEYIACGCVLQNRTLFEGVNVLPPGSAWTFHRGQKQEMKTYFNPEQWETQTPLGPSDYYEHLRDIFKSKLPLYFDGGQRVALSLTGGLDSRMILALYQPPPDSLPCYTFGGMFRDCQDVVVARRIAKTCQQSHSILRVGDEFLNSFARYAERTVYLTDGCCNVSHSADLYVNERARQIAPVRMTGNYGGEVLRRIRAFKPVMPASNVFQQEIMSQVQFATNTYSEIVRTHPLSFSVFRQAPWHHYGLRSLEETQLSLRSPYLDNDLVRLVFRAPESAVATDSMCRRIIAEGNPALAQIPTDRGIVGTHSTWMSSLIQSYRTFSVKAEYAYDYGMPQAVAQIDHMFAPMHLERLFLGRNKFYHFRVWYRDTLAQYVQTMLLDSRSLGRSYVNPGAVNATVRGHIKGNRNYTSDLHLLLTLELVHRLFIDAR